jgi:hypothetical protein
MEEPVPPRPDVGPIADERRVTRSGAERVALILSWAMACAWWYFLIESLGGVSSYPLLGTPCLDAVTSKALGTRIVWGAAAGVWFASATLLAFIGVRSIDRAGAAERVWILCGIVVVGGLLTFGLAVVALPYLIALTLRAHGFGRTVLRWIIVGIVFVVSMGWPAYAFDAFQCL